MQTRAQECWKNEACSLPKRTNEILKSTQCCLFGEIISKPLTEDMKELEIEVPLGTKYKSPIIQIRQLMQLYANIRPCKAFPGNHLNYRDNIDLVIFRENTEGLYSGIGFYPNEQKLLDAAGMSVYNPKETAVDLAC